MVAAPDNVTVVVADVVDQTNGGQTQPIRPAPSPATTRGRGAAQHRRSRLGDQPRRTIAKRVVAEPEPPPATLPGAVIIAATLVLLLLVAGWWWATRSSSSSITSPPSTAMVTIMRGIQGPILGYRTAEAGPQAASTTATSCPISYGQAGNRLAPTDAG